MRCRQKLSAILNIEAAKYLSYFEVMIGQILNTQITITPKSEKMFGKQQLNQQTTKTQQKTAVFNDFFRNNFQSGTQPPQPSQPPRPPQPRQPFQIPQPPQDSFNKPLSNSTCQPGTNLNLFASKNNFQSGTQPPQDSFNKPLSYVQNLKTRCFQLQNLLRKMLKIGDETDITVKDLSFYQQKVSQHLLKEHQINLNSMRNLSQKAATISKPQAFFHFPLYEQNNIYWQHILKQFQQLNTIVKATNQILPKESSQLHNLLRASERKLLLNFQQELQQLPTIVAGTLNELQSQVKTEIDQVTVLQEKVKLLFKDFQPKQSKFSPLVDMIRVEQRALIPFSENYAGLEKIQTKINSIKANLNMITSSRNKLKGEQTSNRESNAFENSDQSFVPLCELSVVQREENKK